MAECMLNNEGNFVIDGILALSLIACMIILCERSLYLFIMIERNTQKEEFYETLPELFEAASRLYDD